MSAHFAMNSLLQKTHRFHRGKLEAAAAPSAPSISGKKIEDIFARDSSKQESPKQFASTSYATATQKMCPEQLDQKYLFLLL